MALESYPLERLRDDVLAEFGRDKNDPTLRDLAVQKVNDAQTWLSTRRVDWPWMVESLAIDVQDSTTSSVDVTKGSRFTSAGSFNQGDCILAGGQVSENYYIVVNKTSTGAELDSQWRGATTTAQTITVAQGIFEMPEDFMKVRGLTADESASDEDYIYVGPSHFRQMKRKGTLLGLTRSVYTVTNNPLETNRRKYIQVYPAIDTQTTLYIDYQKMLPELVNDTDHSIIPIADSVTLLKVSYWFTSVSLKEPPDRIAFYRGQAMDSLETMKLNYDYSEDPGVMDDQLRSIGDWIGMPEGYPDLNP